MRKKKINNKRFICDCVNKMFEIIKEDIHFDNYDELSKWVNNGHKNFYNQYKFSLQQEEEFKAYFLSHIYDCLPTITSKKYIQNEYSWFMLDYGFYVEDNGTY